MHRSTRKARGTFIGLSFSALCVAWVLVHGCGDDIGSKRPGEPCTRTDQCMQGLECTDGVCRDPSDGGSSES